MDSILDSIKKQLGVTEDHFDPDIVMGINTALFELMQIGVGPETGFSIIDSGDIWQDFLGDATDLESVKSYVHIKVKLLFDPPQTSFAIESMNNILTKIEWRLNIQVDLIQEEEGDE